MVKKEIRKHSLIPKHKKLSDKEKKALLDSYNITVNELPVISKSDPALVDMDLEIGDVLKIERDSPTAGKTIFYRGVSGE